MKPEPGPSPTTKSDRRLPRAVFWLGVVSLATDASSEMIYPLLPLFLVSVLGAGQEFVGAIEGAAEALASLLKLVSGRLADRARRKKPLTIFGYGISSTVRPLVGLATAPWMVLAIRLTDRVGKGLRSSPRDALIADATPADRRGRAFGFHRAMDNTGAMIGPAIATALLVWGHLTLRTIFLLAIVPGVVAMIALVGGVRERAREPSPPPSPGAAPDPAALLRAHPRTNERALAPYLAALTLFALGNASDAFLLLRAQALGVAAGLIPALWLLHNAVKAALSTKGGALSDRLGRRRLILCGWVVYGLTYLGFGLAHSAWQIWILFCVYGIYYSLVEGTEKALVVDLVGPSFRGRAFGLYYAVVGLAALPASLGFGWLADHYGALVPFSVSAALALSAAVLLWWRVAEPARPTE